MKRSFRYFVPIVTLLLALLSALSPFAVDTYLSAMPKMANAFDVEINLIEFTITFYFIGFATGQFLGGPLSDSFGRKTLAIIGLLLYGISAFWIPSCNNIKMVWGLRFLQAVGGGFASVTNMAFVRDWFEGKMVAKLSSMISLIMMLAPMAAPLIGGALMKNGGWEMIFYFMSIVAAGIMILFFIIMPESRKKEDLTHSLTARQFLGKYKLIFSKKETVLLVLAIGFSISGMFAFITTASFVYLDFYQFEVSFFFLLFGSGVAANILMTISNAFLLKRFEPGQLLQFGLALQFIAAIGLMVGVNLPSPPFAIVFPSLVLVVGALGFIFPNGTAIVLNSFPQIGGSANAVVGVIRFAISSIVCSLISLFHTGDLRPLGIGIFFSLLVANLLFLKSRK